MKKNKTPTARRKKQSQRKKWTNAERQENVLKNRLRMEKAKEDLQRAMNQQA